MFTPVYLCLPPFSCAYLCLLVFMWWPRGIVLLRGKHLNRHRARSTLNIIGSKATLCHTHPCLFKAHVAIMADTVDEDKREDIVSTLMNLSETLSEKAMESMKLNLLKASFDLIALGQSYNYFVDLVKRGNHMQKWPKGRICQLQSVRKEEMMFKRGYIMLILYKWPLYATG